MTEKFEAAVYAVYAVKALTQLLRSSGDAFLLSLLGYMSVMGFI